MKKKTIYGIVVAAVFIITAIFMIKACSTNEDKNKNLKDPIYEEKTEENIPDKKESEKQELSDTKEKNQDIEEALTKEDSHEGQAINPLTGLWIDENVVNRRPVAVMINNHKRALPQHGLSQADIIYEAPVEGEFVRFMAIFQDFDAEMIGPIRSARHYYLDFAFDYDAVYVHYGQSVYALEAFNDWEVDHLNGLSWLDEIMCWRDPERRRTRGLEHSAFTNAEKIMNAWDAMKYRKEKDPSIQSAFHFADEDVTVGGQSANTIILPYSYYQTSKFQYDPETKRYKRFQFDEPHIDANTNEQLTVKNLIIQFADIWTIKGDKNFCKDMELLTTGKGLYITNGKAMPITWKKTDHRTPTQYMDEAGNTLKMNKGNTWISVYPKNQELEIN